MQHNIFFAIIFLLLGMVQVINEILSPDQIIVLSLGCLFLSLSSISYISQNVTSKSSYKINKFILDCFYWIGLGAIVCLSFVSKIASINNYIQKVNANAILLISIGTAFLGLALSSKTEETLKNMEKEIEHLKEQLHDVEKKENP